MPFARRWARARARCGGRCWLRAYCCACAGAALGVLSARPMVAILARYASRFSVRALDLTVDSSMLWMGAGLASIAAVLLAFVPRLPLADASHGFNLASGSVRVTGSASRRQRVFVVTQIAACFVLLAGASMLLKTLLALAGSANRLRHASCACHQCARDVVRKNARANRQLLQGNHPARHRTAGCGSRRRGHRCPVARRGQLRSWVRSSPPTAMSKVRAKKIRTAQFRTVSPGFFAALGVPLIAGRDFDARDREKGESVVIVSQSVAQRMFPNQDAVNHHLMWTDPVMKFIDVSPAPRRIIGVVADMDDEHVMPGPALTVYHPLDQDVQLFGGRLFIHAHSQSVCAGVADHPHHPRNVSRSDGRKSRDARRRARGGAHA